MIRDVDPQAAGQEATGVLTSEIFKISDNDSYTVIPMASAAVTFQTIL